MPTDRRRRVAAQGCCRVATLADAKAVGDLRRNEYLASPEFQWSAQEFLDSLKWGAADNEGLVCGVWDGARLVATMRAQVIQTRDDAPAEISGMSVPGDIDVWPAFILRAAATAREYRQLGLNSLLRLHFLEAMMKSDLRYLLGYVAIGAPRTRLMQELGFEFLHRQDDDPLHPSAPMALAWLDLKSQGPRAADHLRRMLSIEFDLFPWLESPLDMAAWLNANLESERRE